MNIIGLSNVLLLSLARNILHIVVNMNTLARVNTHIETETKFHKTVVILYIHAMPSDIFFSGLFSFIENCWVYPLTDFMTPLHLKNTVLDDTLLFEKHLVK